MNATQDRLLAELDELTATRKAGEEATKKARQVVAKALRQGVTVAALTGRPFSRAEVQNIKRALRDMGEIK